MDPIIAIVIRIQHVENIADAISPNKTKATPKSLKKKSLLSCILNPAYRTYASHTRDCYTSLEKAEKTTKEGHQNVNFFLFTFCVL